MAALSLLARRARVQALRDALSGGAVRLHAFPPASSAQDAPESDPLVTITLPALGMDSGAAAFSLTTTSTATVVNSGAVYWARFVDAQGQTVMDCLAGLPGSGKELIVTNGASSPALDAYEGGEITLLAWQVSEP